MIFGSFICPVCGRKTKLLPPTKNTLKERFGVNIDGVEYYCPSTVKLFPRTVIPKQLYIDVLDKHSKFLKNSRHVILINEMCEKLSRSRIHFSFNPKYVYRCEYCESKLAVNFNPFSPIYSTPIRLCLLLLTVLWINSAASEISVGEISKDYTYPFGIILIILLSAIGLWCILGWIYSKHFLSNIVNTDLYDDLIPVVPHITINTANIRKEYLHSGNIFTFAYEESKFTLYLCKRGRHIIQCHICGINGEQEQFLALIRQKQELGETVTLPLTFEDRFVGKAEVIKILESSDSSSDK